MYKLEQSDNSNCSYCGIIGYNITIYQYFYLELRQATQRDRLGIQVYNSRANKEVNNNTSSNTLSTLSSSTKFKQDKT